MNGPLAAGAACLTAVMVGATFLACYWRPARPAAGGRHRVPARVPAPLPVLERREALGIRTVWCAVEHRPTEHVEFALGGLMCLGCTPWGSS